MVVHANSNSPKYEPLKAGIDKAIGEIEYNKTHIPDWLKADRFKENSKDIRQDLDKDYEPDRD